jgi:hypothetical protein
MVEIRAGKPLSMLAFGHRLRRLAALTEVCQPASIATINSTASSVPAFRLPPFMRGFSPPPTSAACSVRFLCGAIAERMNSAYQGRVPPRNLLRASRIGWAAVSTVA